MFEACGDPAGLGKVGPLETTHSRGSEETAQPWVLPKPFGNPAPARIPGDVHHGSEHPVDSCGGRFGCGHGLRALDQRRIPGTREPERNREDRAKTVNRIETEDERNSETRILDRDPLEPVAWSGGRRGSEERSHFARGNQGGHLRVGAARQLQLGELADALCASHALKKIVDAPFHRLGGIFVDVLGAVLVQVDPAGMIHPRLVKRETAVVASDRRRLGIAFPARGGVDKTAGAGERNEQYSEQGVCCRVHAGHSLMPVPALAQGRTSPMRQTNMRVSASWIHAIRSAGRVAGLRLASRILPPTARSRGTGRAIVRPLPA